MNLKPEHVDRESRKKIGLLKGRSVMEFKTTGGLHLVVAMKDGGGFETLGTGPHRAVARYIAEKREPEIQWQELSKSDYVAPEHFAFCVPSFEKLTDHIRTLEK